MSFKDLNSNSNSFRDQIFDSEEHFRHAVIYTPDNILTNNFPPSNNNNINNLNNNNSSSIPDHQQIINAEK